ncbi:MAG: hypothetical protein HC817_02015 [Saprospiraceae bacterium]|nr:hypothetical protein [Saprospiraceae bacterium]
MSTLLTLCLTGIISMLSDLIGLRKIVFPLVLVGLATALAFCIVDWNKSYFWFDMVHMDNYALAFTAVMCTATILWLMMSEDYFSRLPNATDRYALAAFVLVGGMVMVCFSNLVMLFWVSKFFRWHFMF